MNAESASTPPLCAHCGTEIWPADSTSDDGAMHRMCAEVRASRPERDERIDCAHCGRPIEASSLVVAVVRHHRPLHDTCADKVSA